MPEGQLGVLNALDAAKTQWCHLIGIVIAGIGFFTDAYDVFCFFVVIFPLILALTRLRSTCHGILAVAGKARAIVGAFGSLYAAQSKDPKKVDLGYPTGIVVKNSLIMFGVINLFGMLFTLLVPESNGKSLEELSGENEEDSPEALEMAEEHTVPV